MCSQWYKQWDWWTGPVYLNVSQFCFVLLWNDSFFSSVCSYTLKSLLLLLVCSSMTWSMWCFLHRQQLLPSPLTSWMPPSFAAIVRPGETEAGIGGRSSDHLNLIQGVRSFTHSLTTSTSISLQSNWEPVFSIYQSARWYLPHPIILIEKEFHLKLFCFQHNRFWSSDVSFTDSVFWNWFHVGGASFYG